MKFWSLIFIFPLIIFAQFSPGKLSKYHQFLEGNLNCIKCHEIGNREISDGCNECHHPLKLRIDANQGFHKDKKEDCGSCHSDHNGEEFELVYWPKDIKKFDHSETGYILTGEHKSLECKNCHTEKFIKDNSIIDWAKEYTQFDVLDRTFLGLKTDCYSCHENIHEDKISNDCSSCHNTDDWELAKNEFDHNKSQFLLTGSHFKVDCEKCHPIQEKNSRKIMQLTGMAFENCNNCHEDSFHKGAYGPTCETCHTSNNWNEDLISFDHSATNYSLNGKHENVNCNECHLEKLSGKLPQYDQCNQCHEDKHYGQFENRKNGSDCEYCHNVNNFIPSIFTTAMHQLSRLKLDGSHLAVPCNKCHESYSPKTNILTTQFTWQNYSCNVCHNDIHRNQFKQNYNNDCEKCHNTELFSHVNFDHQKCKFPLDGRHKDLNCNDCHISELDSDGSFVRYSPIASQCSDCHTFTDEIK